MLPTNVHSYQFMHDLVAPSQIYLFVIQDCQIKKAVVQFYVVSRFHAFPLQMLTTKKSD